MKKFIAAIACSLFVFAGCSIGDIFVDTVAVHNGLIQKMDRVVSTEGKFYDAYYDFLDDSGVADMRETYEEFKTAYGELDTYFTETNFASSQQVFIDEYNEYYKDFAQSYIDEIELFIQKAEGIGYNYEELEQDFLDLDEMVIEFADIHTRLVDTINVQADVAVTAS